MKSLLIRGGATVGVAVLMALGGAAAANASATADLSISQQSVPTIAPGSTGSIAIDFYNNGPDRLDGNYVFQPMTFVAPNNTTFTTASFTVNFPQSGSTITKSNCTLSSDKRTITCAGPNQWTSGTSTTGKFATATFSVQVDASAPASSTLSGGSVTWTENTTNGQTWTDSNQANNTSVPLSVQTPAAADTPIVDPAVAGGAGILIAAAAAAILIRRRREAAINH